MPKKKTDSSLDELNDIIRALESDQIPEDQTTAAIENCVELAQKYADGLEA
jgi:exonuclease VII small subunit